MLELFAFVLISVSFFYLFVCVDSYGTGPLSKIKNVLFEKLPEGLRVIGRKICGVRFVNFIDASARYVCFEPNPIVQIVYFVCAFGGFYIYIEEGFSRLPNQYLDNYHKYTGTVLMLMCYTSYFMACWVDPGRIDRNIEPREHLRAIRQFKFDGIMFEKKNKCKTCTWDKPARSKHCSMCKSCIEKFDHHCVWINQCVGLYNYRFFLAFLYLHAILCTYGLVAGYYILADIVDRNKLYEQTFVNTITGEHFKADFWIVQNYLMQEESLFCGVVLLCLVISIMLYLFFAYHMHLVYIGCTTNEKAKRSQLTYYLEKTAKFMTKWEKIKKTDDKFEPAESSVNYYGVEKDWSLEKIRERLKDTEKDLATMNAGSPYKPESFLLALK